MSAAKAHPYMVSYTSLALSQRKLGVLTSTYAQAQPALPQAQPATPTLPL
jgi:hypothetical protein